MTLIACLYPAGAGAVTPTTLFDTEATLNDALGYNTYKRSIASAGDVNGDGFDDVLVSSRGIDEGVQLYFGSATGLSTTPGSTMSSAPGSSESFGFDVAGVGDVNGDGFDDVLIGDPGAPYLVGPFEYHSDGSVYLYLGSSSGLSNDPVWVGAENASNFGSVVSGAGDVNGDGFDDFLVSTIESDWYWNQCGMSGNRGNNGVAGSAYLYLGGASVDSMTSSWQQGGPLYSCYGFAIAAAGDVDGDGFDDVAVASPFWGWGETNHLPEDYGEGRVFVFRGTMSGLEDTASWSQSYPRSGSPGSIFGSSVSGAGDINADGFDDLIVRGAAFGEAAAREGYAFVFLGSSTGLGLQPHWSTPGVVAEVDLPHTYGKPVSAAGDVDGDGYDDVLVSGVSAAQSERLELWLFHGSGSGPLTPAAWTRFPEASVSHVGYEASRAGDVNGDGYDDIVFTNYYHPASTTTQSDVIVAYGSPNPTPEAASQSVTTPKNLAVDIELSGGDLLGDPLVFSIVSEPQNGSVDELTFGASETTYRPSRDFAGSDSFEFMVEDPFGNTDTARVDIAVVDEAPYFDEPTPNGPLFVSVGEELVFNVLARDRDRDELTYGVGALPAGASFEENERTFSWRPAAEQAGAHLLVFSADDGRSVTTYDLEIVVEATTDGEDAGPDAGVDAGSGEDTGPDTDADDAGFDAADGARDGASDHTSGEGCGCSSATSPSADTSVLLLALFLGVVGRRRWAS